MKKQIVVSILLVGLFIPFFLGTEGVNASANQRGTTGNIVPTDEITDGYFPTTELIINLANLTKEKNYGLLIGANQLGSDRQWHNFTASKSNVEIKTTHFTEQSTAGLNVSGVVVPNLNRLKIDLYGILNDEDTQPILLDTFWLRIRYFDEQLPEVAMASILAGLIIMGALTGIFLTVLKYTKN